MTRFWASERSTSCVTGSAYLGLAADARFRAARRLREAQSARVGALLRLRFILPAFPKAAPPGLPKESGPHCGR